ncbi:MAG: thioredoxin domain-containing protein [Candidatus Palauibacterales bacterium]|nr:thioredoxin domain-containing protein [Candidatus Palauibacterales bacterium]
MTARPPLTGMLLTALATALVAAAPARAQDAAEAMLRVPGQQSTILERADRARVKGDPEAPIRIVEISDFECPFCARFYAETYKALDSIYVRSGTARYLWISFPNSAHPRAWPAIEAAFCAGAAGRFWEMHDVLFERREEWSKAPDPNALFRSWAEGIGIDGESFAACLLNDQTAPLQVRDYESAIAAGVGSTPFFVIGDSVAIRGAVPLETFRSAVDSVLVVRGLDVP